MKLSPNQELLRNVFEILPMGKARHATIFLTGEDKRYKAVEYNLPVLTRKNVLLRVRDGRYGFVYKLRGRGGLQTEKIYHDITSTKALLRFKVSAEGMWFGERIFKEARLYPQPEWAFLYDNQWLYLFEFSTANNVKRTDLMRKKVRQYQNSYKKFKDYFMAEPITIFVLETSKERVEKFAEQQPYDQFYYTDLGSFETVKKGKQFQAPIYIWGGNGKYYSLFK